MPSMILPFLIIKSNISDFFSPLSSANISKIYKNYLQHSIDGLKSNKKKGSPPTMKEKEIDVKTLSDKVKIKELEKQIELQQIEIEYLKKLSALVQARKDREQQKK